MTANPDLLASAFPFAATLAAESWAVLREQVRFITVPPRATLLQPGDAVNGAYFVARGTIRVFYIDADGQEGTLYRVGGGQSCVLAINCLFSDMNYPAWAEAEEDGASFAILDGAVTARLGASDSAFMKAMFGQVSTRLYDLLATLERAIRLPLEARLAGLLLELADTEGLVASSHERLAAHLGTSREVVSRLLRTFVGTGLVEAGYGRLRLIDMAGLQARAS